jgi:transposase
VTLAGESRERGFGSDTSRSEKIAEAVRLNRAGALEAEIGKLFEVSQQRVSVWIKREARRAELDRYTSPQRRMTPDDGSQTAESHVPR